MTEKADKTVKVSTGRVEPRRSESTITPVVDIYEQKDGSVMVLAEIPGATPDSVDVRVEKGVLTISAQTAIEEPADTYARTYISFGEGSYFRAFALSDEIDREKIQASYNDGLLALHLPKAASAQTRKIEIKGE